MTRSLPRPRPRPHACPRPGALPLPGVLAVVAAAVLALALGGAQPATPSPAAVPVAVPVAAAASAPEPLRPAPPLHAAGPGPFAEPQGAGRWAWPVGPPHVLVRGFVAPATPYSAGHRGIDIELPPGGAVLAPADGVVHFSGRVVDRPVLTIAHPGGLLSSYEAVHSELAAGDVVSAGQRIGTLAHGGHCAGLCLHLGVRLRGEYVSPMIMLGTVPRAVLLPLG